VTGLWFSQGTSVSSINKFDHDDTTEILLKVALNTIDHKPIPTHELTGMVILKIDYNEKISCSSKFSL
jgi:hypothetical protein